MTTAAARKDAPPAGAVTHKDMRLVVKAAAPSESEIALIRQYTLGDMDVDQLYVRTYVVAHNAIDRDNEAFSRGALADFARSLPGKGLYIKHPTSYQGDSGPARGRWFAAELVQMSFDDARALLRHPSLQWLPDEPDAVLLMASAYMVRSPGNADLQLDIDAGIAGDVSIGFAGGNTERGRDAEGRELTSRRWLPPIEAIEASLVWLGAQPGARAIKSATTEDSEMPMTAEEKALFDAALAEVQTLKAALDQAKAANAAAPQMTELATAAKAALGETAATPQLITALIKSGLAYRDQLIEDIITAERARGIVGDTPEDVAAAKAVYTDLTTEKLAALAGHMAKSAAAPNEKGALSGGDPNPGRPAPAAGGVFANPLIAPVAAN